MKAISIFIVTLVISLKGISQDWVYVDTDKDGDKWFIKSTYVSKTSYSQIIRIWTKKELKKATVKKSGKTYVYANAKELQLVEIDCSQQKVKFVSSVVYDAKGKVVDRWSLSEYEQEWDDIVPDSMGESVFNKVCELFN